MKNFLIASIIFFLTSSVWATCSEDHLLSALSSDVRETFQTGNFTFGQLVLISNDIEIDSKNSEYRIKIVVYYDNSRMTITYAIETLEDLVNSCKITYLSPISMDE